MNFFVENWVLFLAAIASGGLLLWPMVKGGAVMGTGARVSTSEAVRLINREKGVLIDVGEPDEYKAAHAVGARSVPFGRIEGAKEIPTNKNLPLVLLCPNGSRANRAAALLRKAGHENAVAVAGGTAAWREANLPIDKTA